MFWSSYFQSLQELFQRISVGCRRGGNDISRFHFFASQTIKLRSTAANISSGHSPIVSDRNWIKFLLLFFLFLSFFLPFFLCLCFLFPQRLPLVPNSPSSRSLFRPAPESGRRVITCQSYRRAIIGQTNCQTAADTSVVYHSATYSNSASDSG